MAGARKRDGKEQATLEEEARVHALGKDLVSRLAMLFKTVRIHSVHNSALQYSVKIFVESANDLFKHLGEFTLRGDVDSVFVGDLRIRPEAILWDNIVHLLTELGRRGIGGITFSGVMLPVGVRRLLQTLLDHPSMDPDDGARILTEKLREQGVNTVNFLPRMTLVTDAQPIVDEQVARAVRSQRAYAEMVVTWQAYLSSQEEPVPDIIRARVLTAVQASVDMLLDDPEWFLASTTFRDPELYVPLQAVNTALLSMAVAERLELTRKALMNLGMSAMYAMSGLRKFGVEASGETTPGGLAERLGSRTYPLRSDKEVLQTPALTRAQRDRLVVAYEHGIYADGSGYPTAIPGKPKHLFASLVTLCARFVELTSDHGARLAVSPSEALEILTAEVRLYDGRALAVLCHMLGPFPVGTLVELTTGELAVVFRTNPDRRFHSRPLVKIVRDSIGRIVPPTLFDLTDDDERGHWLASIKRAVPPDTLPEVSAVQVLYAQAAELEHEGLRPQWIGNPAEEDPA